MRAPGCVLLSGLLLLACGNSDRATRLDASLSADTSKGPEPSGPQDAPQDQNARLGDAAEDRTADPTKPDSAMDATAIADDAEADSRTALRDATKVKAVTLTAAPSFMGPTAPFLERSDLTRGSDGLFDFQATVLVKLTGCTGEACKQHVSMVLTREQTTRVESALAVIPGEACQNDPGPICDFGVVYGIGIDGPVQNQTCCKRNEWGQNINVERLHGFLRDLAFAQLGSAEGSRDGSLGGG